MALDFTKIDVEDFLSELGLNNISDQGNDLRFSCPFSEGHRNADANPSAFMEKGTTRTYCFGCGWKGNAVTFLADLENVSPLQSAIWIKERFGDNFVVNQGNISDSVKNLLRKKEISKNGQKLFLDELEADRRLVNWEKLWKQYATQSSQLDYLPGTTWEDIFKKEHKRNPMFYMFDRGFDVETLTKWKIGWDKISERFSIPIRDEEGSLVGFKGRSMNKEPRYLALGGVEYGFEPYETSKILFALNRVIKQSEKYLTEAYKIIVREGELNTIAMHRHGFDNTVGISGKNLSFHQAELIKKHASKAVFFFDDERDAIKAAEKLRLIMPTSFVPSNDKDPAEMMRQEIASLLAQQHSGLLK